MRVRLQEAAFPLTVALALLAATGAAQAQTEVRLVGNTGQIRNEGLNQGFLADYAQGFSTGSNAAGYLLTRVDIVLDDTSATAPTYSVSIHAESSNLPGASLGGLTNPTSLPGSFGLAQFTAAGGIWLSPSTSYFVVVDVSSGGSSTQLGITSTNNEGSDYGWTISNTANQRANSVTTWILFSQELMIAVYGHPLTKMVSNTGVSTLTEDAGFDFDRAIQFTTGSGAGGYLLNGLKLNLKSSATVAPVYKVSIQGDSSGAPDGTDLAELVTMATLTASYALVEFAASGGGISLNADTDYWVVLDVTTGDADSDIGTKVQNTEDPGGLPGWNIGNESYWRQLDNTGNWAANAGDPIELEVVGSAADNTAPTFQSATVDGTSLSVTFNENMDSGSLPAGSTFTVSGGRSGTGTATISGATVSVTLDSAVPEGETVTLDYTPPDSGKLRDAAGNLAAALTSAVVTNLMQAPLPPPPPADPEPEVQSEITWVAPYWSGYSGGFVVEPAPGRSSVEVECGSRTAEYEAEDGLVVRLVRSRCSRTGLRITGAAPGGWYWQHGDRNAAVAPLVRSDQEFEGRAVVPGGVEADVTDAGTWFSHDTSRLVGIVPHLAGNQCDEYVTPYWQGHGGIVARPVEGRDTVTVRVQCGWTYSSSRFEAGADGVVAALVQRNFCADEDGNAKQGRLTVKGAAPGGWYWIKGGRNAAVAPLMCASLLGGPAAKVPAGVQWQRTDDGTFFQHDAEKSIGVVPHLLEDDQ